MSIEQTIFLSILFLFCLTIFFLALTKPKSNQTFTNTHFLSWLGIFVWGDALIVAPFWFGLSALSLYLQQWNFFFFVASLFWVVRSLGETLYWIHEQFAGNHRNKPEDMVGFRFVKNDSIWFLYQLFWQMMTVVSIVSSVYFGHLWLQS